MKNNGKYHKQLKIVFLSIAAIFIFVVMGLSSLILTKMLKQKYQDTVNQTVNSENSLAEVCLSTVYSVSGRLLQNEAIRTWANSHDRSSFYYDAIEVKNELYNLVATFSAIPLNPAVTTMDDEIFVIDATGTSGKKEYFEEHTELTKEQLLYVFTYFQDNSGELVVPTYDNQNSLKDLYCFLRKPYSQDGLVYFIKIPRTSLLGGNMDREFIIFGDQEPIAYSHNNETAQLKLERIFGSVRELSLDSYNQRTPITMDKSDVYLSSFKNSQWKIAYVYDSYDFSPMSIITYTLLPFAVLCIFLYLIFYFLTAWLYKPIQSAMQEIAQDEGVYGTSIDEFLLFRQNAVTARKLADQLQDVVNEKTALLLQRFYRDIVLGISVLNNPLYKNSLIEIDRCCVALFHFDEDNDDDDSLSNDIFFSKNILFSYAQQNENFHATNISHADCAIILKTNSLDEGKKMLHAAVEELSEKQTYKIALSNIRSGIDSIHTSYLEACKIMEYKYLYLSSDILTAEQIHLHQTDNYHYPIILEHKMIQNLAEGKNNALDIYDNLIRENFSCRELSPETLHSFIFALLGTINRAFQELKTNPDELLGSPINLSEYYTNWNHPNIISSIRMMLEQILQAMQEKNSNSDSTILDAMRNYIYQNYTSDMTLNDMADALGISAKYCSNLFKKLSNDTFKNFLNHYRIEQAKELLEKNPNIKISELSELVGFNSANTFIRVFGKYTGMPPGAYLTSVHKDKK